MAYLVFSQERGQPDVARLASHGARFFQTQLEPVIREPASALDPDAATLRVRLSSSKPPFDAELTIRARDVTPDDLEDARRAETRGKAAGMSALAERCPRVWELDRGEGAEPSEVAYVTLAGICASVALGPVLPPDHATLFGVRGAMERRRDR